MHSIKLLKSNVLTKKQALAILVEGTVDSGGIWTRSKQRAFNFSWLASCLPDDRDIIVELEDRTGIELSRESLDAWVAGEQNEWVIANRKLLGRRLYTYAVKNHILFNVMMYTLFPDVEEYQKIDNRPIKDIIELGDRYD